MSEKTIQDSLLALANLKAEPPEGWQERDRRVKAAREASAKKAAEENALQRRRQLVKFGVPVKDVERVCVRALDQTMPLDIVQQHDEGILVLSGGVGCGKTTAAAWWLSKPYSNPYLELGNPLFIPVFRLERLSRYSEEQMGRVERARRLVIDDLGTEFLDAKDNFVALFRGIVDARYADQLPLVITTNLPAARFKERYGERIVDRLREVGRFVEMDAPSLRGN